MKRYRMDAGLGYNEGLVTEVEDDSGDWVRFSDIQGFVLAYPECPPEWHVKPEDLSKYSA